MSVFVERANLPRSVQHLLIGSKYADLLKDFLDKQGICPIFIPENPDIDERLSGHCDLSIMHGGGDRLFLAPYLRNTTFADKLKALGAKTVFPNIMQSDKYPDDAQLNISTVGTRFIFCANVSSKEIVTFLTINKGLMPIECRQGYARCSVCVVDEGAVITSDRGIAKAASESGISVLLITEGNIRLSGFKYGFIGGAAFKLSDDQLAFTGSLDGHPDRYRIFDFLSQRGISPVFLTDMPIFDIGGAVPLTEKELS